MFRVVAEGDVYSNPKEGKVFVGSRIAVLPDGKIACTFNEETKIGSHDFSMQICYSDDGENWSAPKAVWPQLTGKQANYASIRNTLDGRVCIGGVIYSTWDKDKDYWSDEIGGMLENKLLFSVSDDGYDFPRPAEIDLAYYGSAENPGGAFIDKDGSICIVYSPYRAIEMKQDTQVNRMVAMKSKDGGKTFSPMFFAEQPMPCQYGESWLVRLSENTHMVSTWQTARVEGSDQYYLSFDGTKSFEGPFIMPFNGQTTALDSFGDGRVLVVYNYRSATPAGVYLAMAKPDKNGFNMITNECVWQAEKKTQTATSGEFDAWTDFAYGEPHVKILPDGHLLVCLWYDNGEKKGIRYVKLAVEE